MTLLRRRKVLSHRNRIGWTLRVLLCTTSTDHRGSTMVRRFGFMQCLLTKDHCRMPLSCGPCPCSRCFGSSNPARSSTPWSASLAGCPCRVHARRLKYETHWIVSMVQTHSCLLSSVLPRHRNLTSTFVANVMYGEIVKKTELEAKHIIAAIEQKVKYKISYAKA